MSMATVMSEMPDLVRRVLAEHVPDGAGRCGGCRDESGRTASWPCQTHRIAQEAEWVGQGNLPGTGPHGSATPPRTESAGRRAEPAYSVEPPRTGSLPDLGHRSLDDLLGRSTGSRSEGGRRRRRDDDAPFGAQAETPYGSTFGIDDRPRHAK